MALAVINFQDRCHVSTAIAIIGCAEDSDHLLFLSQENKHNQPHEICKMKQEICQEEKEKKKHQGEVVTWPQLYPSITSWWALAISFKLFVWLNCSDMSYRNKRSRLRKKPVCSAKNYKHKRKEGIWGLYYLTECISSTPRWDAPTTAIIRVRPQKITHGTLMGNFLNMIKITNVIKGFNGGR